MIKAVVFDCFGVLLADVLLARRQSIAQANPAAAQALSDIIKASNRGMTTREESAKQMADIMQMSHQDILAMADSGEVKNELLMEYMRELCLTHKLALVSNVRSRERIEQRFDPGELDSLFDVVIASGDVGVVKPERQIYEMAAEALGVSTEECVMVDDIQEYCDGAIAAGMQAIKFVSTEQAIADIRGLIDSQSESY